MRSDSGGKLMWGITVAALLWSVEPIGAIPLESWDSKILNAGTRFQVLPEFGGEAVLDKETQLVWQQLPAKTLHDWSDARFQCTSRTTGGRKGWRLPSVHELNSLIDPSVSAPGPALPPGHPFANFHRLSIGRQRRLLLIRRFQIVRRTPGPCTSEPALWAPT